MPDKCPSCIDSKPEPMKFCKCERCGYYRPLRAAELVKVAKRAPKHG